MIDKAELTKLAAKLVTIFATLVPVVIAITVALREKLQTLADGDCSLGADQAATFSDMGRLLKSTAFANDDTGCDYNITLSDIFAMSDE